MDFGVRQPGEHVLLREVWQRKVWTVRPVTVVRDTPGLVALYIREGALWRGALTLAGQPLRVPWAPWQLSPPVRWKNHGLRLALPGEPYSLSLTWDSQWRLINWYVNVEEPLRPSKHGFDYMDWTLDIIVAPDMASHEWKDEDELAEAVKRGVYTREHALEIRQAAECGLERLLGRVPPFDQRWEDWRPDPGWAAPELPERWD